MFKIFGLNIELCLKLILEWLEQGSVREVLMMATRDQKHLTKEKYRLAAQPDLNGSENTMTV